MSSEYEVRWGQNPDFAEVAEALKCRTDQILGMVETNDNTYSVMFTPEDEQPTAIYSVTLKRAADGVLVVFGQPIKQSGLWEEIQRRLEEIEE